MQDATAKFLPLLEVVYKQTAQGDKKFMDKMPGGFFYLPGGWERGGYLCKSEHFCGCLDVILLRISRVDRKFF